MSNQKSQVPVMYLETLQRQDSGYVRDDTAGTAYEEKIDTAGITFIPNIGSMREQVLDVNEKPTGGWMDVPIRYIKNCPYIRVDEQKKYGFEPHKIPSYDAISLKKGKAIVENSGDKLYEYLKNVNYNLSNPNRSPKAKPLFKVVEIEKKVNDSNELDFVRARAVIYVESLVLKTGNSYKYKEDKIDSILTLIGVHGGDNYSEKINSLTHAAKNNPVVFLQMVTKADDILTVEVTHALEANVITFKGNTVEGVEDKKVYANLGTEKMSHDRKITVLAELLRTPEYASAYQDIKTKTELAQEKMLK